MATRRNAFVLATIGLLIASSAFAGATYSAYTVQAGDTLYRIAQKFKVNPEELRRNNKLTSSALRVGQVILVPNLQRKHTVQAGETLYGIARKYGVGVEALQSQNKLLNAQLKLGQVLLIPDAAATTLPNPAPANPAVVAPVTTTVTMPKNPSQPNPSATKPNLGATIPALKPNVGVGPTKPNAGVVIAKPNITPNPQPTSKPASPSKPAQPSVIGARPLPVTPNQTSPSTEQPVLSDLSTSKPTPNSELSPIKTNPNNSTNATQPSSNESTNPAVQANNPAGALRVPITTVAEAPLPDLGAFPGANEPTPDASTPDANPQSTTEHTVADGETLYRIGLRYGVSVEAIRQANKLSSDVLEVGQKLSIPDTSNSNPNSGPSNNETLPGPTGLRSIAESYLGVVYVFGGTTRAGLDCSGFVYLVFQELGLKLPRTSREQWRTGDPIERNDLREGDLVFFNTTGQGVSHVGIYLGEDQFINAASNPGRVIVSSLSERYWNERYLGARRVLSETNPLEPQERR